MQLPLLFMITVACFRFTKPIAIPTFFKVVKEIPEDVQLLLDTAELLGIDVVDTPKELEVLERIDNLHVDINVMSQQIQELGHSVNMIQRLFSNLKTTLQIELNLHEIRMRQNYINKQFKKMEKYIMYHEDYENSTLIDFADSITSHGAYSVSISIQFIYDTVMDPKFLNRFSEELSLATSNALCREEQSLSQTLHNFFSEIFIINIKGFALIQTAYIIKKMYKIGNFSQEIKDGHEEFKERTNKLVEHFRNHISQASLEFRKCDPEQHVQNETFLQVTNFLHGFVLNEINLNPEGNCRSTCDDFRHIIKTQCYDNEWCKNEITCPKIVNCQTVSQSMTVCSQDMGRTYRRYGYIEFKDKQKWGDAKSCRKQNTLEMYKEFLFWKCSYCFCLCDEGPKFFSERYINLHLSRSNISDNMVVTGLRFIKHNGIIHLQVQEGRIMEYGQIDLDTVHWVPPLNYSRLDKNVTEGRDYHKLSWEERGFDLEDIMADKNHVITGVRFIKIRGRLYLEGVATHYNFTTGKLTPEKSYYQENKDLYIKIKFGRELKLSEPDIPTRFDGTSTDFTTDHYVQFTHSDFKKDAGQTTVPFFDAQPVASAIPVPLSGVGIFHRGKKGYGGFIAPRIFTYNFTEYLGPAF